MAVCRTHVHNRYCSGAQCACRVRAITQWTSHNYTMDVIQWTLYKYRRLTYKTRQMIAQNGQTRKQHAEASTQAHDTKAAG